MRRNLLHSGGLGHFQVKKIALTQFIGILGACFAGIMAVLITPLGSGEALY